MDGDAVSTIGTMNKEDGYKAGGDSTGTASKSKEKKIPHYLRASTGSCHDLCKYGKKHIPVEKPWRSTTKKTFKKAPLDDDLNETLKPSSSKIKKKVSDSSSEVVKYPVSDVSSGMKKPEALIISSGYKTPPVKQMKKKIMTPDSLSRSVDDMKPRVFTKSYSALSTSKRNVASPVLKSKMGSKSGGKDKETKIEKSTVVLKKVPVTPRTSLSPKVLVRLTGNSSLKKSQSLKGPSSSSSSRTNQKPRRVNRTDESNKQLESSYPVEEKTLHIVEMETTNKVENQECNVPPLPPTQSETEEYEYPSESNEADESGEEEDEEESGEKNPRAVKEGDSLDEAARKLQFRRGKVVDIETVGESARKLKFRKGKGIGEEKGQDDKRRRSFKKREDIVEEEADEDGEKVVLRHQDVMEKDAQGLFNNVIEETASKLVEARKSKVKALVGAFETVISLQESKPNTTNSGGQEQS